MRQPLQRRRIDHSITFVIILFILFLFSAIQLTAQDIKEESKSDNTANIENPNSTQAFDGEVSIKVGTNTLLKFEEEGPDGGSIFLPDVGASPVSNTGKLYSMDGDLYWAGSQLNGGSGASAINDLIDGKTDAFSLFLGNGAGVNDDGGISDGIQNYNTGIGFSALSINTGGNYNTAVGYLALYENNNCDLNTAIGFNTLNQNGKNITEFGQGYFNTAIGGDVLSSNTTGSSNTGVGASALLFYLH